MNKEKETRAIFDAIHREQLGRPQLKDRLRSLTTTTFLKVPDDFFSGKYCADIGCGTSVNGTINLLNLGARHVCALDLDKSFMISANKELETKFAGRYSLHSGTVFELPFDSQQFDHIVCEGVLHHLENQQAAIVELHRILKRNGSAAVMVAGNGGLLHRFVFECVRDEYQNNKELSVLIDSDPKQAVAWWIKEVDWLLNEVEYHGGEKLSETVTFLAALKLLIDEELMLTIKDRIQSPINKGLSDLAMRKYFSNAGFTHCERVQRRVTFGNIRKIFAPLYYHQNSPLAKLLYGDGSRLHYFLKA